MRINCPTCAKSYTLADGAIGPSGRTVRCARCGTTWLAGAPEPAAAMDDDLADAWSAVRADLGGAGAARDEAPEPPDDDWFRPEAAEPESAAGAGDDPFADAEAARAAEPGLDAALGAGPVIDATPEGFADRAAVKPRPKAGSRKPAARPKRRPAGLALELPPVLAAAIAAAGFAGFLAAGVLLREPIVRVVPDLASLYGLVGLEVNLRGLAIRDLRTYGEVDANGPVLVVEGEIANISDRGRTVPMLRFGLKSAQSREIYAWSMEPMQPTLAAGERSRFRSRLPLPPEAASEIEVRFAERRTSATRTP